MIGMAEVVEEDGHGNSVIIGYIHADGRGFAAWDRNNLWLGRGARHRFKDEREAVLAVREAYRSQKQ